MLQFNSTGLEFKTLEQCEQFHMIAFSTSCATCECSDQDCPWGRRHEPPVGETSGRAKAAAAA
jgi:hypothetical protein